MDDGILVIDGVTYISANRLVTAMLETVFNKYDVGVNRIGDCERDAIEHSLDLLDLLGASRS